MGGDKKHQKNQEKIKSPHKNQPTGQNIHEDVQNSSTAYGKNKKNQGIRPSTQHEKPILH